MHVSQNEYVYAHLVIHVCIYIRMCVQRYMYVCTYVHFIVVKLPTYVHYT